MSYGRYKETMKTGMERAPSIGTVSRGEMLPADGAREWRVRLLLHYGVEQRGPARAPFSF